MTRMTRRAAIAGIAALPVLAVTRSPVSPATDPILAAIATHRAAAEAYFAARDAYTDLLREQERHAVSVARSPQANMGVIVSDGAGAEIQRGWTAEELRMCSLVESMIAAEKTLARTQPTTAEGAAALMRYVGMDRVPSAADWRVHGIHI